MRAVVLDDGEAGTVAGLRVQQGGEQGAVDGGGGEGGLLHDALQGGADLLAAGAAEECRVEVEGDGGQHGQGQRREPALADAAAQAGTTWCR